MSSVNLPDNGGIASLSKATSTGAGTTVAVSQSIGATYALQVQESGGSSVVVNLEGSINADDPTVASPNWVTLATWTQGTQANGDIVWVSNKPVSVLRANWASGTATNVTAHIIGSILA